MKNIILGSLFAIGFLAPQIASAQGTTYISSLGETATSSSLVGNDSWLAMDFSTGNNASGYVLNTVQLAMTAGSVNASGFSAMLYSSVAVSALFPGSSLSTLNGSLSPVTAGIYTYTPTGSLILSPNTYYFIVLTSGTSVASGAYGWSVTSTFPPSLSAGWSGGNVLAHSSDGLNWGYISGTYAQFAINATPVPEPGVSALLFLGGLGFLWHRRNTSSAAN